MSDEVEEEKIVDPEENSEEVEKKPRFKLSMPNPIIFIFIVPAIIILALYITLSNIFLSSDLIHEEKLEIAMIDKKTSEEESEEAVSNGDNNSDTGEVTGGGFLDTHNYFQFPMAFAVNIPDTKKNLTFELAVSTFQTGVGAEWFFESFTAFVPALRSEILYFVGKQSLQQLQSDDFQDELLVELKNVINAKLESLGAKPEVNKVLFLRYIIT